MTVVETKLTAKLHLHDWQEGGIKTYVFWCPACAEHHSYQIGPDGRGWTFNGNAERPTFTPSPLLKRSRADYEGCGPRCHLFITDGQIHFCGDCEHELAGQTVDMVDIESSTGEKP